MDELVNSIFAIFSYWWLVIPLIVLTLARDWWLINLTEKYIADIKWVLLELSIPKENVKSAKAMEQVVNALHGTYSFGIKVKDRYVKGKVEDWMSLETVGFSDGVHFFIRTPVGHRHLVESAFLSEYPDAEIFEVEEDYVQKIKDKPFANRDIFGADFALAKADHFPLKTYEYFEDKTDERMLDPLATMTEVMATLKNNEALWIQLLIRPTGDKWREKGQEEIDDLMGVKKGKGQSSFSGVAKDAREILSNIPTAMVQTPVFIEEVEVKLPQSKPAGPASQDKIKAVYNKMSKNAFECILRVIYIDDKDEFTPENVTAFMGALRQFSDQNLNQLAPHKPTLTTSSAVGLFNRKKKLVRRKRELMINYIERAMPKPIKLPLVDSRLKTSILSSEEVATLFHPPSMLIKSQGVQVIQSRRGQAPMDLPTKER
ncbi:MAG: hypothetical protein Q8P99_01630 [bacterium]|nr:hypothetical protein [bacterium]MDZ4231236.1 hypothetical protein [Patescibacteria group bacterium]